MTETDQSPAPTRPPLTVKRTLVVTAASFIIFGGAGATVFGVIYSVSTELSVLLLGVFLGILVGYVLAVATIAIGLRGRARARAFTGIFAAALFVAVAFSVYFIGFWFFSLSTLATCLFAIPLIWAIPAAATSVLRLRRFAVVLGSVLVLALLVTGAVAIKSQQDRQSIYDAYAGPIYAPSTSPDSPLDGYRLIEVHLPDQDDQTIVVFYGHRTNGQPDTSAGASYQLEFSEHTDPIVCEGEDSGCPVVGDALGSKVVGERGTFYVLLDDGVITLYGSVNADEAVKVFNDLSPSTMSKLDDLHVDSALAGY